VEAVGEIEAIEPGVEAFDAGGDFCWGERQVISVALRAGGIGWVCLADSGGESGDLCRAFGGAGTGAAVRVGFVCCDSGRGCGWMGVRTGFSEKELRCP
jgi:hypothetical protein